MRFDLIVLFFLSALPMMFLEFAGAHAQSTYAVSPRVPATCPKGYAPDPGTGLCPARCPSTFAANTNGDCVPLPPVVIEQPVLLAPPAIDAATPVDPAHTMTCTDGKTWNAVQMRCEH